MPFAGMVKVPALRASPFAELQSRENVQAGVGRGVAAEVGVSEAPLSGRQDARHQDLEFGINTESCCREMGRGQAVAGVEALLAFGQGLSPGPARAVDSGSRKACRDRTAVQREAVVGLIAPAPLGRCPGFGREGISGEAWECCAQPPFFGSRDGRALPSREHELSVPVRDDTATRS